ncbi:MAG: YdcF family protein, partial [Bacteroidia bacterium]|nr:YdcF family protein [Bacteroidia bacterium]
IKKIESQYVKEYLFQCGIPDSAVIAETESRNTYENAVYTSKILNSMKISTKSLLITSAMHIPRAAACFKKQNVSFDPFPVQVISSGVRDASVMNIVVPNSKALFSWDLLLKEFFGTLVYRITGKC